MSVKLRNETVSVSYPEPTTKDKVVACLMVLAIAAGLGGAAIGAKEVFGQLQEENFPEFNAEAPAKIIGKDHDEAAGGGLGTQPSTPGSIILVPGANKSESYSFELSQAVRNGDGDRATAVTHAEVGRKAFENYQVGDTIVPLQITESKNMQGYTHHERVKSNKF